MIVSCSKGHGVFLQPGPGDSWMQLAPQLAAVSPLGPSQTPSCRNQLPLTSPPRQEMTDFSFDRGGKRKERRVT